MYKQMRFLWLYFAFHSACAFLATSHKCTIFKSLVILSVGTLSSGVSYAMLARPNKAERGVHGCQNSELKFFSSYRVNSLYHCRLCALSVAMTFPFILSAW